MEQFSALAIPTQGGGDLPEWALFLLTAGITAFAVIWQMLYLGFLATAYTDGSAPQQPGRLVSVGRYFFWRIMLFQLLLAVVYMAVSFMALGIFNTVFLGGGEPADIPEWAVRLCSLAAVVILAKPILIVPAIIIVRNCRPFAALSALKEYKLLAGNGLRLLGLFLGCFVTLFLVSFVLGRVDGNSPYRYVAGAIDAIIASTAMLVIGLSAVQFVAGRNLATESTETAETAEEERKENF